MSGWEKIRKRGSLFSNFCLSPPHFSHFLLILGALVCSLACSICPPGKWKDVCEISLVFLIFPLIPSLSRLKTKQKSICDSISFTYSIRLLLIALAVKSKKRKIWTVVNIITLLRSPSAPSSKSFPSGYRKIA